MTSTSVVMVSYHTGPILFASINAVLKQPSLSELILVDNGNTPDTLARLRQMALNEPRLRVVTGHGNVGYAKGCNLGAQHAKGYFLLLLNPDCLLPPEAIDKLMLAFEVSSDAVLVGASIVDARGKLLQDSARPLLTFGSGLAQVMPLRKQVQLIPTSNPEIVKVPAISGACMCLRRKDFERLGGMDEAFFISGAGMDLCFRVHKLAGAMMLCKQLRVTRLSTHEYRKPLAVQWHRTRAVTHYFAKHFTHHYPLGFLTLVRLGAALVVSLRIAISWLKEKIRPSFMQSHTIPAKRLMVLASGLADLPETKELTGKTVLVTGATSQVGLCVVRRMIAAGAGVLAISRSDPIAFEHAHLRWIKGDLTHENLDLDGYLVDVVVHCAPLWHLPAALTMLAEAEVKRVIAFGSTSIFGKHLSKNHHEKELVEKLTRAERDIAERCESLGMKWTIIRSTMTYGVGLDLNVSSLAKLIRFLGFLPVYPPAIGKRQPTHADDLGMAAVQLVHNTQSHGKSYNVSGGEVVSYREMLERIFKSCNTKLRIEDNTMLPFILDVAGFVTRKKHINGEIARRMNDDLMFFHDDATHDFGYSARKFLSGGIKDIEGY